MDLFWGMDRRDFVEKEALKSPFLHALFAAKGWMEAPVESGESPFEFRVMMHLGPWRDHGDLRFEYRCKECRHVYPVYFHRCPSCHAVESVAIEPMLTEAEGEPSAGEALL